MPMIMMPVDVPMARMNMDVAPVMVMMMTVPVVGPGHDDNAATAQAAVATAPIGRIVMRPSGNAVHPINHRQVVDGGLHTRRCAERHRFGALNERTCRQHRGDCRDAQPHFAHLCTSCASTSPHAQDRTLPIPSHCWLTCSDGVHLDGGKAAPTRLPFVSVQIRRRSALNGWPVA